LQRQGPEDTGKRPKRQRFADRSLADDGRKSVKRRGSDVSEDNTERNQQTRCCYFIEMPRMTVSVFHMIEESLKTD